MSATVGKDGAVKIGGSTVTFIDSWSLEHTIETVDVTSYGDEARERIQTFREWNASITGTLDRSDAQQAALLEQFESGTLTSVQLQLYTSASSYWYGSAVLSGGSVESNVADKVAINMSFQSAGQLYWDSGA